MRILVALFLMISPALAQEPPYAPITITEQEYKNLMTFLMQQPMGAVEGIVNWLRRKEVEAQQQAREKK